jgi:hypothetical protein
LLSSEKYTSLAKTHMDYKWKDEKWDLKTSRKSYTHIWQSRL